MAFKIVFSTYRTTNNPSATKEETSKEINKLRHGYVGSKSGDSKQITIPNKSEPAKAAG